MLDDDGVETTRLLRSSPTASRRWTSPLSSAHEGQQWSHGNRASAADLLYTGGSIKPPADWSKEVTDFENAGLYDELVLSFTLRVDDEYKFLARCGLFNTWRMATRERRRRAAAATRCLRVHEYVRRARKVGLLGSSWFTSENMEELATYAADSGYLYQAWEKSDKHRQRRFTSMRLRVRRACASRFDDNWFSDDDYSDGYYDSEDDDGEYDSEMTTASTLEDDDGEYDDEYDSESVEPRA